MTAKAITAPSPSLADLSASLFHDARADRLFMVMTGYFDESGTHDGSPVVIVAGFVATAEKWGDYERDLAALNAEYGVSVFHAKDWRGRKGSFKGWPHQRRATYNSRFLRLADAHLTWGAAGVLVRDEYDKIYRAKPFPPRARPDTPYGMCFRTALLRTLMEMRAWRSSWPLNIIMEDGNKNLGDAIRVFGEIRNQLAIGYTGALGYISFGSKRDCLPIAIADSLAYAIFRLSAGLEAHPTNPNAAVVGPADPPHYVSLPMARTRIEPVSLIRMRDDLLR